MTTALRAPIAKIEGLLFMARKRERFDKRNRDLDIEIEFLEGLVSKDPGFVEALQLLAEDYTRRGRYEDGLRIDLQLARMRPNDPIVFYNLACSYSLVGDQEAAYKALCHAIECGYDDFDWLAKDPDLANFRAHPTYKLLKKKICSLTKRMSAQRTGSSHE